jgi:hypothetical protein
MEWIKGIVIAAVAIVFCRLLIPEFRRLRRRMLNDGVWLAPDLIGNHVEVCAAYQAAASQLEGYLQNTPADDIPDRVSKVSALIPAKALQ